MANPLATVIVLCYNQAQFVEDAILSVINQSYQPIELIVVDDASTDGSKMIIEKLTTRFGFRTIYNSKNTGNCISFNQAFTASNGTFIIDLAADDLLKSTRIEKGVEVFQNFDHSYGIHFCDAEIIREDGTHLNTHYKRNSRGKLLEMVPEGEIFKELVERYFICTPTMMIRREVLEALGGYDEQLTYEDFDFWVRSSRKYKYVFSDEILVQKRTVKKSLSKKQKIPGNKHILSTAMVCQKAFDLCIEREEYLALRKRVQYELKWAALTGNFKAVSILMGLLRKIRRSV